MDGGRLTWATAKGPMAATWLTLRRIGWDMVSSFVIITDEGQALSLLEVPPRDFRDLLKDGIARWQCRKAVAHLPESQGEVLRVRAVRAAAKLKRPATEKGALQVLWSGGHWTGERRHGLGFASSPACVACGADVDDLAHRWCPCPALMVPRGEEEEMEEPFAKNILAARAKLDEMHSTWTVGDSVLPMAYGLPLAPPALPPPPA